jgi:hypothetical protein
MDAYILKTLKKLRKETPRLKVKNLVTLCDQLIGELSEESNTSSTTEVISQKHFEPLQIACSSKIPRLMDIALDAIHYMMGWFLIILKPCNSCVFLYLLIFYLTCIVTFTNNSSWLLTRKLAR